MGTVQRDPEGAAVGARASRSLSGEVAQRLAVLATLVALVGGVSLFALDRALTATDGLAREVRSENRALIELSEALIEVQVLAGRRLSPVPPSDAQLHDAASTVDGRIAAVPLDEPDEEALLVAVEGHWLVAKAALGDLLDDGAMSPAGARFFPAVSEARTALADLQLVALDETAEELASLRDRQRTLTVVVLVLAGLSFAGAAGAAWTFHRRVRRPLRTLLEAAEELGVERWPDGLERLEPAEFGRLGAALNVMAERMVASRAALEHRAFHDELTDLPNRALFRDRLERALARCTRSGADVALALVDLDHFKDVNDRAGHSAGDAYLVEVAHRLAGAVRAEDTVARLGGDEFAILLEGTTAEQAGECCERILQALAVPLWVSGRELVPTASIGVARKTPGDRHDSTSLLRDADVAMYVAKSQGRATWRLSEEWMRRERMEGLDLAADLERAIAGRQLHIEMQPIVGADDKVLAVEALVRWHDPARGPQSPASFLRVAEQAGLMPRLGGFVVETALEALRRLDAEGVGIPSVSINVSPTEVDDPSYADRLLHRLETAGIDPARLTLELTETTMAEATLSAVEGLRELRARGVRVSIDDFGVGHSSLSRLSTLPFDELKLDGSFVRQRSTQIIEAVAVMCNHLGVTLVMEGIERAADLELVRRVSAPRAQGFFLCRPLPPDRLAAWVRGRR